MTGTDLASRSDTSAAQQQQQKNSEKARGISAIIAKLALHYWRPDFTEAQSKALHADFIADLSDYPLDAIEAACAEYRREPANRFFPHPGAILGIIRKRNRADEASLPRFAADVYRAPESHMIEHRANKLRPWREIAAECGGQIQRKPVQ